MAMQQADSHPVYNSANYPVFLAHNANWQYRADDRGNCAAIAVKPGAKSSHMGNLHHVSRVLESGRLSRLRSLARRLSAIERKAAG